MVQLEKMMGHNEWKTKQRFDFIKKNFPKKYELCDIKFQIFFTVIKVYECRHTCYFLINRNVLNVSDQKIYSKKGCQI